MITTNGSIDMMRRLFMEDYTGSDTVETGYKGSEIVPTPKIPICITVNYRSCRW